MKRYPAFDPPEYVRWKAEPAVVREYRKRLGADPDRARVIAELAESDLLGLYEGLLRNRLHDIALKRWVKSGVISKAWLGTGEEAATIGPVHALRRTGERRDVVAPMIRNAGACHEMGMAISDMLRGYLGTSDSPSAGRDGHVGDLVCGVVPPISHLADMVPVTAGVALSFKLRGEDRVAMTWVGDGSTKTTGFHEGVNLATVQRVPAIFIIQNNQVALGTRLDQHGIGPFSEWPKMYGAAGGMFDGNNVLDAYAATRLAAERARAGDGVTILVADTFRMGGHATHDEREARDTFAPELFEEWGRRDPIGLYENWLEGEGMKRDILEEIEARVTAEVDAGAEQALASRDGKMPVGETAAAGVYGDMNF
jgi:TPP-dependent pyruvate/acetoin dehydrogenase alpha subunit